MTDRKAMSHSPKTTGPKGDAESTATGAHAHPDEAGAYIGRLPEREADTVPGGVRKDDERIAAYGSAAGQVGRDDTTPSGHREGRPADNAAVREAGQDR